jgi:hypothetical protein
LYKNLLHKSEFGQAHCEEWFKRSPTKFNLKFFDTPTNFYEFWKFETISGNIYLKRKIIQQCTGRIPARGYSACTGSLPRVAGRNSREAIAWLLGPASKEERAATHRNGMPTVTRCKRRRVAAFKGGGLASVVIDEGGWVLQHEGDMGVRRRRSIEGWSSSEGHSPEGGGRRC